MQNDERCCGSGTCIIDANGLCWCGQRWQGDQLCSDNNTSATSVSEVASPATEPGAAGDMK
jgi:hypothetical protein